MDSENSREDAWHVVQPSSPRGSSSDGGGGERGTASSETARTLDEKSCASSWELVQRASSGPGSTLSPSCGSASVAAAERKDTATAVLASPMASGCGVSEASGDLPGEEFTGEVGADFPSTCNWYPQDSMEIDAMLAQELGLLATGPEFRSLVPRFASTSQPCVDREVARPSVCHHAQTLLQHTGLPCLANRLLGAAQKPLSTRASFASDVGSSGACTTEVLSLKTFLDEDVPKFPFSRSPRSSAMWTRVTA